MSDLFAPRVGGTVSADIAVPEHDRVVRFYTQVLGTGEAPLWRDDLMNNLGMPVIGLGPMSPEYEHLPLQWMPHIQVADVAKSVERTLELGGQELMHAKDDDGNSQWAVLLDPNGAAFGIIPVVPEQEIPDRDPAAPLGHIAWLDLTVPNAEATRDFYSEVVGWTAQAVDMKDGDDAYADFNMLAEDGVPAAGVCHARGKNLGLPPVWMLYLPVGDLAESLRLVEDGEGKVIKAIHDKDGKPSYAVIQDPIGACLALVPG